METIPTQSVGAKAEGEKKEKTYLYHMVPEDMRGTTLHPLNTLKELHHDLYVSKAEKYKDRMHVMEQFIPALEARWNDVIQFAAVKPDEIKRALIEAGFKPTEMKFYQVDPALLDPAKTVIYLYQDKEKGAPAGPESFQTYDPEGLAEHTALSDLTKERYKEAFTNKKRPLLFVGVPHILHKGSIDISDLPVITV